MVSKCFPKKKKVYAVYTENKVNLNTASHFEIRHLVKVFDILLYIFRFNVYMVSSHQQWKGFI